MRPANATSTSSSFLTPPRACTPVDSTSFVASARRSRTPNSSSPGSARSRSSGGQPRASWRGRDEDRDRHPAVETVFGRANDPGIVEGPQGNPYGQQSPGWVQYPETPGGCEVFQARPRVPAGLNQPRMKPAGHAADQNKCT